MADPVWPNGLRNAGASGVRGGPQANVNAFEPETGPPITHRNSTTRVRRYPISLPLLTKAERDIFVEFVKVTLKDGILPFMWVDPMEGYNGSSYDQRMKLQLRAGENAYEETRVTNELYTIDFAVILL